MVKLGKFKKPILIIVSILTVLLVFNLALNFIIKNKLPKIIAERNNTPYVFDYDGLSFNLFASSISIRDVSILPKKGADLKNDIDFTAKVDRLSLVGVNFIKLLTNKDLAASRIYIKNPDIVYFKSDKKPTGKAQTNLGSIIDIGRIILENGHFRMENAVGKEKLTEIFNLNIDLNGVQLDQRTLEKNIPFTYENYNISCDSIFHRVDVIQYIKTNEITLNENNFVLKNFRYKPELDPKTFKNTLTINKSLINIEVPLLYLKDTNWGFNKQKEIFVDIGVIHSDSIKLNIDAVKNDGSDKLAKIENENKLDSIGSILPFNLKLDSVNILHSKINSRNRILLDNVNLILTKISHKKERRIVIGNINLVHPDLLINSHVDQNKTSKSGIKLDAIPSFSDSIYINNIRLLQANFRLKDVSKNRTNLLLNGFNFDLNNVVFNPSIAKESIPIHYSDFQSNAKKFFFQNDQIFFTTDSMKLHDSKLQLNGILFKPQKIDLGGAKIQANKIFLDINSVHELIHGFIDKNAKNILMKQLVITEPLIEFYPNKNKSKNEHKSQNKNNFENLILLQSLKVNQGKIVFYNKDHKTKSATIDQIQIGGRDLIINKNTIGNPIPFDYKLLKLTTGKIWYEDNSFYKLTSDGININNRNLEVNNFVFKPKYAYNKILRTLKKEEDFYDLSSPKIQIENFSLGKNTNGKLKVGIHKITGNKFIADIYRSLIPPDDPSVKTMFSTKLRNLKFQLDVDQLELKDSKISYSEETETSNGAGKLTFSNFNAKISNIKSAAGRTNLPDVKILVDAKFMQQAPMHAEWTFNVLSRDDKFNIKGTIDNLQAKSMNPFLKPYMKVSVEGDLQSVKYNFTGTNLVSNGTFGLKYDNLKVTVYNKDGEKKKKFLSAIGNIFVRTSTKGKFNEVKIKPVERSPERSFFNFFWKSLQQGLKQTLL